MADAQAGDAQPRAVLPGREGGGQAAERHGQGLAVLQQMEFAQRELVQRDIHRQRRQVEGRLVLRGRRLFGSRRRQRHRHGRGRQLAHVQPPLAQRAPVHFQAEVRDFDARAARLELQPSHVQATQHRAAHVQRLAVQLLRRRGQQQARAALRAGQPEQETAGQHRQHRQPGQPPHQKMAQDRAQRPQNAIPREKCSRRLRSRWP